MLPAVQAYGGRNIFAFDQMKAFPVNLSYTTRSGACNGLALHWIKMHKLGQLNAFPDTIMSPSSIRDVENLKAGGQAAQHVMHRTLELTGLAMGPTININSDIFNRMAMTLANRPQGYEMIGFNNSQIIHAVALARSGNRVDFFDPNYGCASFPCRQRFIDWFRNHYWDLNGGPGNPGPCTASVILCFS